MPNSQYYKKYEGNEKLMVGKSDISKDEFDVIIFADRDIQTVKIPSYIKQISGGAFCGCEKLKVIEIPPDSKLQIIGEYAFHGC